jgi:hypothetical protein
MVTTPCPHCNQKIEFEVTMPGTCECPHCNKQFKVGQRTNSYNKTSEKQVEYGQEITIQLQSNNNGTSWSDWIKVGISVSLFVTIIGLVVTAIALYLFFTMFLQVLGSFGGGGW